VLALAGYQAILMAVGYGWLRPRFLTAGSASAAHRVVGDVIVALVLVVAAFCLGYYGIEDSPQDAAPGPEGRVTLHVVASFALLGVLALKLVVLHLWHRAARFLPLLGLTVLFLLFVSWFSSAGAFLLGPG